MATASQTIEQPTLPPVGEADSLAGLGPANPDVTSVTVPGSVTEVVALDKRIRATMGICGQLVAERDKATAELRRQAKDILYPALIEMREHYSNAGARTDLLAGIPTFEAYLASIGFCSSILRVWEFRQRQKELESLLPGDGQKRLGSGSSKNGVAPQSEPEAVTIARRELSQLEEQIGTSACGTTRFESG
jgi:hypothetical protein